LLLVLAGVLALTAVCQKKPSSPVIARVGKQVLTLEDVQKSIPPQYSSFIDREQMINYVKQWIDAELLYQEALRTRVQREKEIRQRLEKMRRDLLGAEIINRHALAVNNLQIAEAQIQAYYESHRESFVRESDVVKYIEIVTAEMKTALAVRNQVTDQNFVSLAGQYSTTPVPDPGQIPYVTVSELPAALAGVIGETRVGGTTSPVQMGDGCHIVRVLDKQKAGSTSQLDEVRQEIAGILTSEAHNKVMETLLSNLRLKMDYEFHFDRIPGKETSTSTPVPQSQTTTFTQGEPE
jgi:parvulin-like peptidyl-prolyl isomerase